MEPAPVRLSRAPLTDLQLRATETMLYRMADLIDRLLADGLPYTKVEQPQLAPPGWQYGGQTTIGDT